MYPRRLRVSGTPARSHEPNHDSTRRSAFMERVVHLRAHAALVLAGRERSGRGRLRDGRNVRVHDGGQSGRGARRTSSSPYHASYAVEGARSIPSTREGTRCSRVGSAFRFRCLDGGDSRNAAGAPAIVRRGIAVWSARLGRELCGMASGEPAHARAFSRSPGSPDCHGARTLGIRRCAVERSSPSRLGRPFRPVRRWLAWRLDHEASRSIAGESLLFRVTGPSAATPDGTTIAIRQLNS